MRPKPTPKKDKRRPMTNDDWEALETEDWWADVQERERKRQWQESGKEAEALKLLAKYEERRQP